MEVRHVALASSLILAGATTASVFAAATSVTTIATIAYSILAVGAASVSLASISAWMDDSSVNAETYFANLQKHSVYTIAGTTQFVSQVLFQSLIKGLGDGISKTITRKIAGEDVTLKVS